MKLSNPEQRLLDFAQEQFGEHLSQFILASAGEERVGQRWRFIINYTSGGNARLTRYIDVITYEPTDGSTFLPRRCDSLVLIALLRCLLNGEHVLSNSLRYEQEEVLKLLGWKDTWKAHRKINEAVERYFLLVYRWKMNKNELACNKLSFYTASESLISEFKIVGQGAGELGQADRVLDRIVFNAHFIKQLLNRSLFGIDWNSVSSISCQSHSKKG